MHLEQVVVTVLFTYRNPARTTYRVVYISGTPNRMESTYWNKVSVVGRIIQAEVAAQRK
jgi:hypothetical protein